MISALVDVDVTDVMRALDDTEKWEVLQTLWDHLKECSFKADWQSFYDENNVGPYEYWI